jgi:hypothetical protein
MNVSKDLLGELIISPKASNSLIVKSIDPSRPESRVGRRPRKELI